MAKGKEAGRVKGQMTAEKAKKRFMRGIYVNREYSWLLFNKRVLDQANDLTNPLLERCKFLSIFGSNLDEFFMVRVGSLYNDSITSPNVTDNKTGLTAAKQLAGILAVVRKQYQNRASTYIKLRADLDKAGLRILRAAELTPRQSEECRAYFVAHVLPLLSMMVLDAKHPMMQFENRKHYMIYDLEKDGRRMIGVMYLNPAADRLYRIGYGKKTKLVPVEELLKAFGHLAFMGYTVKNKMMMRVTRNADIDTSVDDSDVEHDFSEFMKRKIESRAHLGVVRLEVDDESNPLKDFVLRLLNTDESCCFEDAHFFDYKFLFSLGNYFPKEEAQALRYPPFKGAVAKELEEAPSLIDYIYEHNVFLSYPYDSMEPVVDLLDECAKDPRVLSVKITIYRLANHSRIVDALCKACERGKQVTVVIELMARFDEENNLHFASKLQEAGCTIIYGMGNYKVHSKIVSIVLKKGQELAYITHLGTGNYNESTAKQYTDLNVITANEEIGEDAVAFFRNIGIGNTEFSYKHLLVAPETLKAGILARIDGEIAKAQAGGRGVFAMKMNSLTDKTVIDKLVEASCAGVQIELLVRGICCLRPGVEGKTENIAVTSVVGRFLEHSRIYSFGEGEERVTYISSADMMTRNTDKRVEIAAPVLDREVEEQVYSYLRLMLSDNVKAMRLCSDGVYRPVGREEGEPEVNGQEACIAAAREKL